MHEPQRQSQDLILPTLEALYLLHGSGVFPDAGALARRLGGTPTAVASALLHLEGRGLVDAATCRLTLPGLAAAAALAAHAHAARSTARAA